MRYRPDGKLRDAMPKTHIRPSNALAEACGNRTHPEQPWPPRTGFEVRGRHQPASASAQVQFMIIFLQAICPDSVSVAYEERFDLIADALEGVVYALFVPPKHLGRLRYSSRLQVSIERSGFHG